MGNDLVLLDNQDYVSSVGKFLKDQTKFKIFDKGLPITSMTTLQNYLQSLLKRGEISKPEFDQMRKYLTTFQNLNQS